MAKLKVLEIPHPVLREKAKAVEKVDHRIVGILDDMLETMYAYNGVGLAANQVGLLERLVVIDCAREGEKPDVLQMVNPKITAHSEEILCRNEGCLSVPREYADVDRFAVVTVEYLDKKGEKKTRTADGVLGMAIQHELDHLDGTVFVQKADEEGYKKIESGIEKLIRKNGPRGFKVKRLV